MKRVSSQVQHLSTLLIEKSEISSENRWADKVFTIEVLHKIIKQAKLKIDSSSGDDSLS